MQLSIFFSFFPKYPAHILIFINTASSSLNRLSLFSQLCALRTLQCWGKIEFGEQGFGQVGTQQTEYVHVWIKYDKKEMCK